MTNGNDTITPLPPATFSSDLRQHLAEQGYGQREDFGWIHPKGGLTKREYFSAMAMQGMCANNEYSGKHSNASKQIAHKSVEIADALIEQLNKTESK